MLATTCPLFSAQAHAYSRQCLSKALADPRAVSPQRSQRALTEREVAQADRLGLEQRQRGRGYAPRNGARVSRSVSVPRRLGAAEADGTRWADA